MLWAIRGHLFILSRCHVVQTDIISWHQWILIRFLLLMVWFTKGECLGKMDREKWRGKKTEYLIWLYQINTHYFHVLLMPAEEKKCFWNYWCNLLASTNVSLTSQSEKIELVNEMLCVCVCVEWEVIEMQKACWSGWICQTNDIYFPSPYPVLNLYIRFMLRLASQHLPSNSCDINCTTLALYMQGNSDQMVSLQINSPCSIAVPSSLPASKLW